MDTDKDKDGNAPDAAGQTITRTVWKFEQSDIVIETMPDGRVLVNGSPVEPIERTIQKMQS